MSRIGKLPVVVPAGVTVKVEGQHVSATGPKGTLEVNLPKAVKVSQNDQQIEVVMKDAAATDRSLWGLSRTLVANLVQGVAEGFSKQLEIQGVGYRAAGSGNKLTLSLGYSHPIEYTLPEGITATVEANIITVAGADKQMVGQVASEIRAMRKPEPYKGKGIRYVGEQVRRKAGKAAAKAGGAA